MHFCWRQKMSVSCAPCALWFGSLILSLNTQHQPLPLHVWVCDLQLNVQFVWAETELFALKLSSLNVEISIYIITAHTITIYIILYTYEPSAGLLPNVQRLFIPFWPRSDKQVVTPHQRIMGTPRVCAPGNSFLCPCLSLSAFPDPQPPLYPQL